MGDIPQVLTLALTRKAPKVIDADAITHLGDPERLQGPGRDHHAARGRVPQAVRRDCGTKAERALEAARRSGAVVVYKGPDTLVASPDGRLGFAPPAPAWLASAGTGDVLAGMIAAMRARGLPAFEAACAAVWLHGRAAEIAGPQMIADDLAGAIPARARARVNEPIVRIAARGDGVTRKRAPCRRSACPAMRARRRRAGAGPHHQEPPCRHFPECGGCQLQHADDEAYRGYLVSRIETRSRSTVWRPKSATPHLSPPNSRRRATLRALKVGQGAVVGFNAEKSHRIVDMRECHILRPELFALVAPLRAACWPACCSRSATAEVQLTLVDQGADVLLKGVARRRARRDRAADGISRSAHGLARLSVDQGLGPETVYEPQPATVTLSGTPVGFPVGGSCRRPRMAKRRWSRRCARRWRREPRSPTCSPASALSRWRCGRRLMRPKLRAMRRRR